MRPVWWAQRGGGVGDEGDTASQTLRADSEIDNSMGSDGASEFEGRDEDMAFPEPWPTKVGYGLWGGVKVPDED